MVVISAIALIIFSALIAGLSAWGALFPSRLVSFVRGMMKRGGIFAAVGGRLVLAVLLWVTAPLSHTPTIFLVLAALALVAAIAVAFMGTERILRIMDRFASWPGIVLRLQCLLGVAFGVFLAWSASGVWAAA